MSRNKRNSISEQFNARTRTMMESPAYRVLSASAHRVIDRICVELMHQGGKNNGRLKVTHKQFIEYGMDAHSVAPGIREACALGFVEVTERGRAHAGEFRTPNLYRLTFVYVDEVKPTNEWEKIETLKEARLIARAARQASEAKTEAEAWKKYHANRERQRQRFAKRDASSTASSMPEACPKNKKPLGVNPRFNGGNPQRNAKPPLGETPTPVPLGETPIPLYISGEGRPRLTAGSS